MEPANGMMSSTDALQLMAPPDVSNDQELIDLPRFEKELEFVQCLANPWYLNYLAQAKYLQDDVFLRYLNYLDYWREPDYAKFLIYPTYTLNALDLLKEPQFRTDILSPDNAKAMMDEMVAGMQKSSS